MKLNRTSSFVLLAVVALLVGVALLRMDRPAKAITPTHPPASYIGGGDCSADRATGDLYVNPDPYCLVQDGNSDATPKGKAHRQDDETTDDTIVIDDGGVTIPTNGTTNNQAGQCKHPNVNRNGHKTCAKKPDTNSGQQTTVSHGGGNQTSHPNNGKAKGKDK